MDMLILSNPKEKKKSYRGKMIAHIRNLLIFFSFFCNIDTLFILVNLPMNWVQFDFLL